SYTTDDLIFDWEPKVPLVVEPTIELPQHILVDTKLGDCMQEYSTGKLILKPFKGRGFSSEPLFYGLFSYPDGSLLTIY
ncbi:hypothetical protein AVEN_4301-1, partial [Araneus ventricosus]